MRALLLGVSLFIAGSVLAQPSEPDAGPPANLTVLVFEQGRPVDDLIVRIGERSGRTDGNGAWQMAVSPGQQRLQILDTALMLTSLPLNLRAGEIIQIIVTLEGEQRQAYVSIESSHALASEALATSETTEPAETGEGLLIGRIVSSEGGEPVANARIFVSGTPVEARTDEDGQYRIELPVGQYSVSVLHSEFATRTIEGVGVTADGETRRDFELPPAGLELAEYVVVEPFIQGSLTAVFDERRQSATVTEVIGSEQISRAGDSDAGSALRRVTGLTLVGGEFIFVRGLGERYSSTLLNGASVPSPDPTRRVVPMDLFPAGVIESIRVQKGFSPDMPGEFGGGSVDIRTNSIPEESFFKLGLSGSWLQGTTFKTGQTYDGGNRDNLGFDDGTRQLPGIVREALESGKPLVASSVFNPDGFSAEELEALGEAFPVIYDIDTRSNAPDAGISAEGGMRFTRGDWNMGFLASTSWGNGYENREEERRVFTIGSGQLQLRDDFLITRTEQTVDLNGFVTAGIEYRDEHRFQVNSMILRQTADDARFREGFDDDTGAIIRLTTLKFEERQLISNQLAGGHRFPVLSDLEIEWDYSESRARREAPDTRIYLFDEDRRSPNGFVFSRRTDNNFRNYSDLTDRAIDYGVGLKLPYQVGFLDAILSAGWRTLDKNRDSTFRRFKFDGVERIPFPIRFLDSLEDIINEDTIGPGGFVLFESTRPTDNSTSSLDIEAWYANLDLTFFDTLRLSGGARVEDWTQRSNTFRLFDPQNSPVIAELGATDILPAIAATWFITDRQQLRLSYAETIIRPDLRELSPAEFTDPVTDREVIGNENLVESHIEHYDLRYDFSPTPSEVLSIGAFYKKINDPIELTVIPGQARLVSFANAVQAENYGIELEGRTSLGFLGRWLLNEDFWGRFTLAGNAAWIESEITIDETGVLTSATRPLQGQSPYVLNLQLGYDHSDSGPSLTLLYNVAGERIQEVGVQTQPDKYEQPFHQLDFNMAWNWTDSVRFKMKFQNLLGSRFKITQGDEVTQRYTKGRKISLGVDLSF